MDRKLASIVLYLVLTSALAVVALTQEPIGWRAFYITVELQQAVSQAQFIIPKDFAILWNKFEHFQFTEPWIIIVQDGVQRQSVVWYHDNNLYVAVYGLSTSTRRLYIYVVEKQLLSSTALQLSQTYWNMQPIVFVPTVNYLLLGFGEISYTHLRDVLAMPPHGFITITESTYDNIRVLKIVPLFTADGRTYVANVYTTVHETLPLTALVTVYVDSGGGEPVPAEAGSEEVLSGSSSSNYIVELTLSPPWFTDFSNTTLCIVEDVYSSKLYYYTVEENVTRKVKRIWVSLPGWISQRGFVYLTITRCNEDWDELSQISGIFLSPAEYNVTYSLKYPRIITIYSFRYYDPYGAGGGLLPGNFTVWCADSSVVHLNFTGHGNYTVPCDPLRYRLTFIREAPLSASLYIEPGDAIAPHLFDWRFTDSSTYVSTVRYIGESRTELTVELSLRFLEVVAGWPVVIRRANEHSYGWRLYQDYGRSRTVFTYQGSDGVKRWILNADLSVGEWYDLAVTFSVQAGRAVMYVNGVAVRTSTDVYEIGGNQQPIVVGEGLRAEIGYARVYSRALNSTEVQQTYSSRIINASGLVLFLDATFYNGTHYIDLSGSNNHGVPYGNVQRVPAERRWIWHVKNLTNDGYLHVKFVPRGWFIEFRRVSDGALLLLIDTSQYPANPAGLVEDIVISVPQGGWYIVNFRPSYPFGAPSPPYAPPELPPPGDDSDDGGDGGGGGGQQFDCSICEPCWTDPSFDFCYDCFMYCEPPGWSPPPEPEATQMPQRQQPQQVVREVPRETQQYSLLLIAALFVGAVGISFFVVGSAAVGLVPHIIYILMLAELVPAWVGALLIASMVILSLYVFLSKRSGGGAGEGG
ncbi:MAG: LamG domain-containing protein [Thermofilaceae archaeon]